MTEPAPITQAVATPEEWTGRHTDISNADYHAGPGISKSGLDLIDQSPAHYRWHRDHPEDREPTPAMMLGTAFHTAVLEPHLWNDQVAVKPNVAPDRRSTAGKQFWAAWESVHTHKTQITVEQHEHVQAMVQSVREHPMASALLHPELIESEVSYYAIDPDTGVLMRCRVDAEVDAPNGGKVVVDLKSSRDASYTEFVGDIARRRYHVQDRYYRHVMREAGYEVLRWYFVACESAPPYGVNVFELGPEEGRVADIAWRRNLDTYAHAEKTGKWPCYSTEVRTVNFAPWMLRSPVR